MFNENLFDIISSLAATLRLVNQIRLVPYTKVYNEWMPINHPDNHLNQILFTDFLTHVPLLPSLIRTYWIHNQVILRKVKTNRCIAIEDKEVSYKNGSIAGLTIIDSVGMATILDNDPYPHKRKIITKQGAFEPDEYILIEKWTPYGIYPTPPMFSIINELMKGGDHYGDISAITGIPHDLMFPNNIMESRQETLIMRVLEDVVIPECEMCCDAIDKQIGLNDDMQIRVRYDYDVDWIKVWKGA